MVASAARRPAPRSSARRSRTARVSCQCFMRRKSTLGDYGEGRATRSANRCQKVSVSFLAVPVSRRAPTLATVPRTSDVALHFRRERFGATGSISRSVVTSTAEPGALPRAASLSRRGGRTSVSSTSSRNLSFTLPTPKADTTLKWRSSTASTDSTPGATDATNSWSRSRCHTCSGGAAISGAPENSSRIPPTCFDIPGAVSLPAMPSHAGASAKLSKSRFLSGLQCHKQLWWRVHEPEAAELTPTKALQNLFAQGAQVGERARRYVPGGELIDLPFYQLDNKVAATREALRRDPPAPALYEAAFLADDTYAAVDILERQRPGGYGLIEVKASNSVKPEHIPDVAGQVPAVASGRLVVQPALAAALAGFTSPLAFLDFETVGLAIPRYAGCRPWENMPVQFSCHVEARGGKHVHHEWIADGPDDPRPRLAEAVVRACGGARRVVAYYASF